MRAGFLFKKTGLPALVNFIWPLQDLPLAGLFF